MPKISEIDYRVSTIKHYKLVTYCKWTNFTTSQSFIQSITKTLAMTNTLAYQEIHKLKIRNVLQYMPQDQISVLKRCFKWYRTLSSKLECLFQQELSGSNVTIFFFQLFSHLCIKLGGFGQNLTHRLFIICAYGEGSYFAHGKLTHIVTMFITFLLTKLPL